MGEVRTTSSTSMLCMIACGRVIIKRAAWLSGHTGLASLPLSSKYVLVLAMFIRVGMDSGIERDTFIGIMGLDADDNGNNISKFVDGILPQAMQMPCVLLLDELDAVRPDIAYVLQPVLEGGALRLLEDGGRLVHPHMDFHICATGNSTGQGKQLWHVRCCCQGSVSCDGQSVLYSHSYRLPTDC